MIRALLASAAVLVVVLAFLLDRPWLYGAAAATLVGTLAYLGRHFWEAYRAGTSGGTPPDAVPSDDSLESLGIMDVRPQATAAAEDESGAPTSGEGAANAETDPEEQETNGTASDRLPAEGESSDDEWPRNALSEEEIASMTGDAQGHFGEHPVFGPFLESMRAALGAQTACLLEQEDVVLEYRIEALASLHPGVAYDGMFQTKEPLLSASMSRQPVTVRSIDEPRLQDLGYYEQTPPITQVALAPIARPESSSTVFLLADATEDVDLGARWRRSLLERFADTVGLLLDAGSAADDRAATDRLESFVEAGEAAAEATEEPAAETEASEPPPRPRREIVAEEMQAAEAAAESLALVLVHLNRAESIARRGDDAVASAERHLQSRLQDLAPGRRVERFGELTYGIFVRSGVDEVESWAAELQDTMGQETGELEGGVSVGVAVRHDQHTPEGLRADATDALLEAYETGTCTIIA